MFDVGCWMFSRLGLTPIPVIRCARALARNHRRAERMLRRATRRTPGTRAASSVPATPVRRCTPQVLRRGDRRGRTSSPRRKPRKPRSSPATLRNLAHPAPLARDNLETLRINSCAVDCLRAGQSGCPGSRLRRGRIRVAGRPSTRPAKCPAVRSPSPRWSAGTVPPAGNTLESHDRADVARGENACTRQFGDDISASMAHGTSTCEMSIEKFFSPFCAA